MYYNGEPLEFGGTSIKAKVSSQIQFLEKEWQN